MFVTKLLQKPPNTRPVAHKSLYYNIIITYTKNHHWMLCVWLVICADGFTAEGLLLLHFQTHGTAAVNKHRLLHLKYTTQPARTTHIG